MTQEEPPESASPICGSWFSAVVVILAPKIYIPNQVVKRSYIKDELFSNIPSVMPTV